MVNTGAMLGRAMSASYDSAVTIIPPFDSRAGDGMFFFNSDTDQSIRNRSPGGAGSVLTQVGDVVFHAGYADGIPLSQYFQSSQDEAETYTSWAVVATDSDLVGSSHQPAYFGNFSGSAGSCMWIQNHSTLDAPNARLRNNQWTTGANNQATVITTDITAFHFVCSRVSASLARVDDKTHGTNGSAPTPTGTRILDNSRKMRYLSAYSTSLIGPVKGAAMGYLPGRLLTDAQIEALYRLVKSYLAQASINITC